MAPVPAAQSGNPQESALFGNFADLFSITVATPETTEAQIEFPEHAAIASPSGNSMPDGTGKELPVAVAAHAILNSSSPETEIQPDAPLQASLTHVRRDRVAPIPLPETIAMPTVAPEPKAGDARKPVPASTLAKAEDLPPQRIEPAAQPAKASPSREHVFPADATIALTLRPAIMNAVAPTPKNRPDSEPLFTSQTASASEETAAKAVTAEKAARFLPVAQLLRPVAANTQTPALVTARDATHETGSQAASPATVPSTALASPLTAAPPVAAAPSSDIARPVASTTQQEPAPAPQRHDFGQVVEKLAEARELSRPARAEMQVTHREFGTVSMQFDVTAGALKVALASAHAGFAPAVQAALAERPVAAPAEAARAEVANHQQAQTSVQASTPAQPGASQSHSDNAHHQQGRHHEAQRPQNVQSNRGEQPENAERDAPLRRSAGRDSALFA